MTRNIVVNGRFLSRRVTGVERYGREIVQLFRNNYQVEKTRANGLTGHLWEQFVLPARLRSESVLWSAANTGPLMVRRQALTIHDLSPLEHPEWFRKSFALWYRLFLPMLAGRVQVIFTPSEYVKQKIIKRFGVRDVIVTPNAVATSRFHPDAVQSTYEFPKQYIFFVGSLQPRKNLQALLSAWRVIKKEYPDLWLVIAGDVGTVFGKINFPVDERVRILGYVTDEDLPGLYSKAAMFILPSFDEGFGLPAIEAMSCGTPVVASNGGALPETIGDAGLIFDLSEPDGLANAMRECLSDNKIRLLLKEKGFARVKNFSWQNTAELVWNTLNEI
ncbi:MAG TPA: glycosyltransferase family 1 protein [Anaerolineae bacterium]|nr:glycosyltransferase family 1 protein [Anaerolineae bacterium]